ncbi:Dehydrogenase/reductase SDR member 7 [Saguinus oedipus]|uniref:Dehydrogenase/reductase SDR member 7 n=1 Tax=Saguinus oedipus TaxID=9490 RepID=A0ABQ9V4J5_SAGOE|nr:Dehydrogenase/reductase SDR member 7 [Saguinus oedipus]
MVKGLRREFSNWSRKWELTDMVVWVTGASSGIGEELAYQLSKLGVSLVLSARRVHELERIDILVNNGGVSQRSLCMDTSLDVYRKLIELNYLGTVSLTKCVLPYMIERKQGKIVTVNSLLGIIAAPLSSGYCASKHALRDTFLCCKVQTITESDEAECYMDDLLIFSNGHHSLPVEQLGKRQAGR